MTDMQDDEKEERKEKKAKRKEREEQREAVTGMQDEKLERRREKKAKRKEKEEHQEEEEEMEEEREKKAKRKEREEQRAEGKCEPPRVEATAPKPTPIPADKKREVRELFLGHCPPTITVKEVYDHWSGLGSGAITNVKLVKRKDWKFTGVAFVEFASPRLCKLAMKLNRRHPFQVAGQTITVNPSFKDAAEKAVKPQLFLGRCPLGATEADIRSHYQSLGSDAIQHVKWVKGEEADTQAVFLTFRSKEEVKQAMALGRPMVQGVLLKVREAGRRLKGWDEEAAKPEAWVQETVHVKTGAEEAKQIPDCVLFWKGVPDGVEDTQVLHFYKGLPKGSVASTRWMIFPPRAGAPQSKCFITFRDRCTAEKAAAFGAPSFEGRTVRVGLVKP
eukprot:GGOE01018546.1.p1 GENE.GGOE01018546.1~~GGOE01018546.1.p1  ORF type:complete len:424 (-),score=140.69 GGOE01018546.1:189-1355(-)